GDTGHGRAGLGHAHRPGTARCGYAAGVRPHVCGLQGPLSGAEGQHAPAAPGPAAADRLDPAVARAESQRILAEVAKARNLAVKSEVTVDVIDKAGIRAFAKASMYEHTTVAELRMLGRIEASLGVLPLGSDPEQVILDLLEQGVLGLYDPKKKTLFIGDFVSSSMLSMVVGHEIAHGLQDMYFDLDKLQEPMLHQSDAESARRFLIEGEAQAAYLAWVSGERGVAALEEPVLDALGDQALELAGLASPYPILARSLQMPYADGTATVARMVKRGGWAAIDALYDKLPETTEQMLHIDKLVAREPAIPAKMDSGSLDALAAKAGLALVWHDNLGEAALLAMLAESGDARPARRAAAGWGGDHFVAFDRKDAAIDGPPTMLAAVTVWDSKEDAIEFEAAFRVYLAEHAAAGHVIDRKDRRVVFATGVPAQIGADALRTALWRGAHVGK
ncbi:MAG: hypothetical protein IAG13_11010, partial [Deltaproteobacteria bacterium]|nr:hypothetical protein [Nannocystaceae bacterium]